MEYVLDTFLRLRTLILILLQRAEGGSRALSVQVATPSITKVWVPSYYVPVAKSLVHTVGSGQSRFPPLFGPTASRVANKPISMTVGAVLGACFAAPKRVGTRQRSVSSLSSFSSSLSRGLATKIGIVSFRIQEHCNTVSPVWISCKLPF